MKIHPGTEIRIRAFRARVLALAAAAFLGEMPARAASPGLELGRVAGFPAEITGGIALLLERGVGASPSLGAFGKPSLGALAERGAGSQFLNQQLKYPASAETLPIPATFSVVMWLRMDPDHPSQALFGFGEPNGDYLLATTDSSGAPMLTFLNQGKLTQFDRAKIAPANLADGRLHALVAVINLGSGLARLYVDGQPEAAATISLWRPRQFGSAFALYALQGRTNAPGTGLPGLLMPRIIPRELNDQEIALIKPQGDADSEVAAIQSELASRLIRDTLMEFWPPQFSYQLRWRPL